MTLQAKQLEWGMESGLLRGRIAGVLVCEMELFLDEEWGHYWLIRQFLSGGAKCLPKVSSEDAKAEAQRLLDEFVDAIAEVVEQDG